MNQKEMLPKIKNFLKETYETLSNGFEGCCYLHLDEGLYIVAANVFNDYDNVDVPTCKIAYNCDDLQCDYDWDWEMPTWLNEDGSCGEIAFVEDTLLSDKKFILREAKYLYTEAKTMIGAMKKGLIKDWME